MNQASANSLTPREFLSKILSILKVDVSKHEQMIKEVDTVIKLTLIDNLTGKLNPSDQAELEKQLADMSPEDQMTTLTQSIGYRYSHQSLWQQYLEIASRDVIPDYVTSLLKGATTQQRQEVEKLLQLV